MIQIIKKIYKKSKLYLLDVRRTNQFYIVWLGFVLGYILVRQIIGLHTFVMYAYLAVLLICRFSFIRIALTFFFIVLDIVLAGNLVEANNYMSYVYVFLVLFLIKEYWMLFTQKHEK